jgi:hypothetical protein
MRLNRRFLLVGLAVWPLLPIAAVVNGAVREGLIAPALGQPAAEAIGVVTALALFYAITFVFLRRTQTPHGTADLWALGICWAILAVIFEFVFFGVIMGVPMDELIAAYNIFAGELWPVVVAGVLVAPPLVGAFVRRPQHQEEVRCPTR